LKAYYAKLDIFRGRGTAALEAESAREKAGDCPNAMNTYEINMCLTAEMKTTQSNYEAYVKAIGGILRVQPPGSEAANPKDTPPDVGKEFDVAEAHWIAYRKAQCSALYDYYIDGTIRGPAYGGCMQELTRRHMRELASIYADLWH
jgi:uncharacterized protein YecT (DUF1311 family)